MENSKIGTYAIVAHNFKKLYSMYNLKKLTENFKFGWWLCMWHVHVAYSITQVPYICHTYCYITKIVVYFPI